FDSDDVKRAVEAALANPEAEIEAESETVDSEEGAAVEDAPEPVPEPVVEEEVDGTANDATDAHIKVVEEEAPEPQPIVEDFEANDRREPTAPTTNSAHSGSDSHVVVEALPVIEPEP